MPMSHVRRSVPHYSLLSHILLRTDSRPSKRCAHVRLKDSVLDEVIHDV